MLASSQFSTKLVEPREVEVEAVVAVEAESLEVPELASTVHHLVASSFELLELVL